MLKNMKLTDYSRGVLTQKIMVMVNLPRTYHSVSIIWIALKIYREESKPGNFEGQSSRHMLTAF